MPERIQLELSGALARSQSRGRAPATRSLMRCRVGPYALVIDLRDLSPLDSGVDPDLTIDLRRVFGASVALPARSLAVRGRRAQRVELLVDPGLELVSVNLTELFDFPSLLHHQPLLRCLCGVVRLEDRLHFLLDPQPLIDHSALSSRADAGDSPEPLADDAPGVPRG